MRLILAMAIFGAVTYWQFGLANGDAPANRLARPSVTTGRPLGQTGVLPGMPSMPLDSQLEAGRITVFVFSGRWCPACRRLERRLRRFVSVRPDVAFKFIETSDRWSAELNIASVPHIVIYDAQGDRIAADHGSDKTAYQLLGHWINEETNQAFATRRP